VSHAISEASDHPAPGAPLGPGSLLWRIAADWRSGLSGLSAGILQLAWPHLGQGVEEHSAFFHEPWDRIHRSVPQIWATIFADDADERGHAIRDLHRDIKGTDPHGQRYHALDPDTFWWAHATFTWEMFQTADAWDHRTLSPRKREQLYQETVTWYRRYGVSDRPVPADHETFEARFDEICRTELELTPTAERAIEIALEADVSPPNMPRPVAAVATPLMRTMTIGGLPPVVRARFEIPWTLADELTLAGLRRLVRDAGRVVPHRLSRGPYLRSIERMGHIAAPRSESIPA
jgi:uncharacterized protein (DUF2236 family)